MKRRHGLIRKVANDRKLKNVDVKMKNIKLMGAASNFLKHHDVMGNGVDYIWIEPKPHFGAGDQFCRSVQNHRLRKV